MSTQVEGIAQRVATLLAGMTLEEKLAQLVGVWVDAGSGAGVAPMQDAMVDEEPALEDFARDGIGQITRFYGTAPVDPVSAARSLRERQRWLVEHTRTGIPAVVHEECLTGLAAWQATTFPVPLSWGASFDPELVREMGRAIGATMRSLGVHQGLAPVLDVVRDARWGRVEECISEDPYLVGTVATSYVRGLQDEGVVATLKHFVGYSASRAGRNLAPVHAGPREVADVLLVPFEMAVLDGGARSVMHSYAEVDGLPAAADRALLTGVLRDRWGFDGVVVADYFGVAFLASLHGVAVDLGDAAAQALTAGVDVELPTGNAYRTPLAGAVRSGLVDEALVDRAVLRALEETEDALVTFDRARARLAYLREAADASQRGAELARLRYQSGIADFLQVLDAERTLLEAQDRLVQGRTDAMTAFVALYKALGVVWPTSAGGGEGK